MSRKPIWEAIPPKRWWKFFMLASKAIGMVVKADDVHALQKDLQKDFVIKSTLLNRVAREAKKNQKPPAAAAEEKKETKNPSGGVNGYLLLGIGGLAVSALSVYIISWEAIMASPGSQRNWGPWARAKAKAKPQSPLNGLNFFYIIYTNKLIKTVLNAAMLYGMWKVRGKFIWTFPSHSLRKFVVRHSTLSKMFSYLTSLWWFCCSHKPAASFWAIIFSHMRISDNKLV